MCRACTRRRRVLPTAVVRASVHCATWLSTEGGVDAFKLSPPVGVFLVSVLNDPHTDEQNGRQKTGSKEDKVQDVNQREVADRTDKMECGQIDQRAGDDKRCYALLL